MTNNVTVTADVNGNIIGVSPNNPEFGYIRVEQNTSQISSQGWLKIAKRSALIKGTVKDLLEANFKEGQVLPGKIVIKESFEPFNPLNPEKDLKIAGDTGIICRVDDQPIYRQAYYTESSNAADEIIMHNNADEIREVQAATRNMYNLQAKDVLEAVTASAATL